MSKFIHTVLIVAYVSLVSASCVSSSKKEEKCSHDGNHQHEHAEHDHHHDIVEQEEFLVGDTSVTEEQEVHHNHDHEGHDHHH